MEEERPYLPSPSPEEVAAATSGKRRENHPEVDHPPADPPPTPGWVEAKRERLAAEKKAEEDRLAAERKASKAEKPAGGEYKTRDSKAK